MKPELSRFAPELGKAMSEGMVAQSDENRRDFYDVDLDCGCFYIHVYDKTQTVYLIARLSADALVDRYEKHPLDALQSLAAAV